MGPKKILVCIFIYFHFKCHHYFPVLAASVHFVASSWPNCLSPVQSWKASLWKGPGGLWMINMWETRFKTWKICKKSIIYIFMYTIVETRFDMFLGVTIDETLQKIAKNWSYFSRQQPYIRTRTWAITERQDVRIHFISPIQIWTKARRVDNGIPRDRKVWVTLW